MWDSPTGIRVLTKPEADCLVEALRLEADMLLGKGPANLDDKCPGDGITGKQRWVLLAQVADSMLCDTTSAPQRSAVLEGFAAGLFDLLLSMVEIEIDAEGESWTPSEKTQDWVTRRGLLASAAEEAGLEVPDPECVTLEVWQQCLENVRNQIVFEDHEMAHDFLDVAPEQGDHLKMVMGIPDDYFSLPLPDPTDADVESARRYIEQLCT
ncbi:MAG: hypothetical protein QF437_20650 [Planctomycetota bacterium]|jgi:hypothetical protein|nr:hypothetical protein [Planctomycetota bacterium]MDP7132918.1 hypothetical protein [Planctomycetota bacterium]